MNSEFLRLNALAFILAFMMMPGNCYSGNENRSFGTRSFGCGQAGSLFTDVWSASNNPGALGFLSRNAVAVSFDRQYNAFGQVSFAAAGKHNKWGSFGFSASRFGPDFFTQSRAGISWGKAFGIASVGLQTQWYQVNAQDQPSRHYLLLNFGGLARLTSKLSFSGCISNLSQTKASDYTEEKLPTFVRAGISLQANQSLLLMAEVQKDLDEPASVNAGIEYSFSKNLFARTGFSTGTNSAFAGFGMIWREFNLDYAISRHPDLGWSHSLGLIMAFGKTKQEASQTKH